MFTHIPTHIIGGPLGAGKTTLIQHLLSQKPVGQRWAVLVNEFGQIGLDAALMENRDVDVGIAEVAGGCVCCVNGVPFQVALGRLLRKVRPDRLFIEPSGLGHPLQLMRQLQAHPWTGVLWVQPLVTVLDAAALEQGSALPAIHTESAAHSGLVVLNKSDRVDGASLDRLAHQFAVRTLTTSRGIVEFPSLPQAEAFPDAAETSLPTASGSMLHAIWTDIKKPIRQEQSGEQGWSLGWRFHPSQRFSTDTMAIWLASIPWLRAKVIVHTLEGWRSANMVPGDSPQWAESAWRRDSRIELIFDLPQDAEKLNDGLDRCRIESLGESTTHASP
jgi:G3E family GTPase